ncbi:MAG TPA: carboxypeptidase-like regulatory domain-containing protein, partial [Thermoplasmata archaeon]|nr:carboxypeptidase-like regulatory domain-containing protein [Thermoplasmata archaeon]
MNLRGHRGIAALLMLLALVLSAMALLPATAQASSAQVTGLVSTCNSGIPYIAGAKVTLSDANGVLPSLSTTTDGAGVFTFTPPAANYTISASRSGYYSNNTPLPPSTSPFRFDGSTTVTVDVCLDAQPTTSGTVNFTVVNGASPSTKIGGAQISVYNPARLSTPYSALIYTNTTNATTAVALAKLWTGSFEVRVSADGYNLYIQTMTITPPASIQIGLTAGVAIVGHARNQAGQFVSAGLVGWLYNPSAAKSNGTKLIPAVVSRSQYNFSAPAGSYEMIVDANGYLAYDQPITIPTSNPHDVVLQTSPQEVDKTTVAFGAKDWNNFTITRNLTLNPDSTLAGLLPAGLRDLRTQINYTLGTGSGSGTVSAGDAAAFRSWLARNGPVYVTTDSFFLLNGQSFNSSVTSFSVSVSNSLLTPGDKVWIN